MSTQQDISIRAFYQVESQQSARGLGTLINELNDTMGISGEVTGAHTFFFYKVSEPLMAVSFMVGDALRPT